MLKPLEIKGVNVGQIGTLGTATIFFGNAQGELALLEEHFGLKINFLKQVHGDTVVETGPALSSADAHWTDKKSVALGIYTADCLPILLSCEHTQRILAIHAGWRGVQNQIIIKSKQLLLLTGSRRERLHAAIGPHIAAKSFEIEREIGEKLAAADPQRKTKLLSHTDPAKCYVPLTEIAQGQLSEIPEQNMHFVLEDTFTNENYFSYRRQKGQGRLISLIFRK